MVAVDVVFVLVRLVQGLLPSADHWIRYPVMGEPPVLDGAVQDRLMVVCPDAVAVSEVGAAGAEMARVVAPMTLEGCKLSRCELIAKTL